MAKRKTLSMAAFIAKKYTKIEFVSEDFKRAFGEVEVGSRWLVYGESGNGKTEFCVQLAKELSYFGKVVYVSKEQSDKSSLQGCFIRNHMGERNGSITLLKDVTFEEMCEIVNRRSIKVVIIDSLDYLKLNAAQYTDMHERFPKKLLVFVAWAEGKKPKTSLAKDVEYMADVKVRVNGFVAFPRSRYGGNEPYVIWKQKAHEIHPFLREREQGYEKI